jgi:hypothetical protein
MHNRGLSVESEADVPESMADEDSYDGYSARKAFNQGA